MVPCGCLMDVETIKKRMLQQRMQEQFQNEMQAQAEQQQIEEIIRKAIPQILDEKARERLNNIKVVKPDLARQLEMYLVQLQQSGQIKRKISEEQLVAILKKLGEKAEFRIRRK